MVLHQRRTSRSGLDLVPARHLSNFSDTISLICAFIISIYSVSSRNLLFNFQYPGPLLDSLVQDRMLIHGIAWSDANAGSISVIFMICWRPYDTRKKSILSIITCGLALVQVDLNWSGCRILHISDNLFWSMYSLMNFVDFVCEWPFPPFISCGVKIVLKSPAYT